MAGSLTTIVISALSTLFAFNCVTETVVKKSSNSGIENELASPFFIFSNSSCALFIKVFIGSSMRMFFDSLSTTLILPLIKYSILSS